MPPSNPPHKDLSNILDASQFLSLESIETLAYQIQGAVRKNNVQLILEDLMTNNNTNMLPFVLSCLDPQQQSWILDMHPQDLKDLKDSLVERLIIKLSRFFLVAPTMMAATLSFPSPKEKEIEAVRSVLVELASLEFSDSSPSDNRKQSQRQIKKQRRATVKSKAINPDPFAFLETSIPNNLEEVEELKTLLITRLKSVLQFYLEYISSCEFSEAIKEICVIPSSKVDVEDVPSLIAPENERPMETEGHEVQSEVYPKVQPMKSALHFDSPDGFGDWIIVIHESAEKELRFRHKKERKTFDIIVKKIKELSHGHFSRDNYKRLNRAGSEAVVFEAKMTSDLRLVYQIDLIPHSDDRVRQALKVFGIFTHAQMDDRLWDAVGNSLGSRNRDYRERCAVRQRTPNADEQTFSPAFFPALPETLEHIVTGKMLVDETNLLHSRFLMAKYVVFSQPLMNTMLADLDATFPHLVSPQEKIIIEHPRSCYVIGRSGTGKTTTLLFKMLLVERTYQLAEPGTPKPRQVFVTQSRILAKKVKEYFTMLARALHVSMQPPDQLLDIKDNLVEIEDDNIALDDIKDWYRDLPEKFSQLEDRHFPLFVTYSTLCSMLEMDMADNKPKTSLFLGSEDKNPLAESTVAGKKVLVDFDYFVKNYWRSLPEPLTKKIDPSLAFSELIGVIKGSETTISHYPHLLPQEAYLEMSERRQASLAVNGARIYALYDAYAKKKKLAGERDVADRTHALLDYLNEFGVPGQKFDQLYVDEVQDNLLIDTLVLRALCLNSNGLFWAGDTAQAISAGSSFSFNELRAFQWRLEEKRLAQTNIAGLSLNGLSSATQRAEIFQLAVNYRSHAGIVNCAHSIIELIDHFWPGTIDSLAHEQGMIDGPKPIVFDSKGDKATVLSEYLFGDSGNRIEFGAQQCILVRDVGAKKRLKEEMGENVGLILTIYDSKGLEFNDVLLYNFFQDSNADFARWRVVLNAIDRLSIPLPKFDSNKHASIWLDLKFLYVAMTRARENVWIADVSDKGDPMKDYWASRDLIRSITPGVDAPRLASSSTPEEWFSRGKQLFHFKKYPEAKHCFERARKPSYSLMAQAYILHDYATGVVSISSRKVAFRDAGEAFRKCSEIFPTRRLEYLRLSAGCYYEAGNYRLAAGMYLEIHDYSDAVKCYLECNMFDEAVKIVQEQKDDLETSLVDKTIKKAKFYYFSSADSLPASDPQRKIRIEQGCQLLEPSEDPLEYLEDRLLSSAMGDVLVAASRFDEAAELSWSEGRVNDAIELFLQSDSESSSRRAGECILEALWQMFPFGVGALGAHENSNPSRLLTFASKLNVEHLSSNSRQELSMFRHISSPDANRNALREAGRTFFKTKNFPAAFLCLDHYFDNCSSFRDGDIPLEELAHELELFHVFVERLLSTINSSPAAATMPKLFGYQESSGNQINILPHSLLHRRFVQQHGPGRVREATLAETSTCIREIVFDRLSVLTNRVSEECKSIKAFTLCLPFERTGFCNRLSCPNAHVRASNLDNDYYTLRVRIHLQIVLLLTEFRYISFYRHIQRRYWLKRLYEALYPPHHSMGVMAKLNTAILPESRKEYVGKIRYWVEEFMFTHNLDFHMTFLSQLLRGAIIALEAAPSLSTLAESRSLTHDIEPSRCLHLGTWSQELTPPAFLYDGGRNSIHDLLSALEGSSSQSLTRGILAFRHIVQKRLKIEISVLCDVLDILCKNLILSRFCRFHGHTIHRMTLPSSWLMTPIDVERCGQRNLWYSDLVGPFMTELLAQIYTGKDAEYLLYENLDLSSPVPGAVRSVFITRICRALALLAYNFQSEHLRQAVFSTTTSLQRLESPPPVIVPYGWYVHSKTWDGIKGTVRRSAGGSSMDEMIEILHPTKLSPTVPLVDIPYVRRLVYDKLENVPSLIQQTSGHVLSTADQGSKTQDEELTSEQPVVEDESEALEEHQEGDERDDAFNTSSPPIDEETEVHDRSEKELVILSKLPAIYKRGLWRRKNNRTAMAKRVDAAFLNCLLEFNAMPLGKYRKMVLGPLPHLLVFLEATYASLLEFKTKIKGRLRDLNHNELDELEDTLTTTNSAIKTVTTLQRSLGPKSGIHITRSEESLKQYVIRAKELIACSLPIGATTEMEDEFNIGWKGIVKPKYIPPTKPEKPKLNTDDLYEWE